MEKQVYITEEELVKCQKAADAFAELYELENIVVLDAGRYGFVKLKYYKLPHGFEDAVTYTDSAVLFEAIRAYREKSRLTDAEKNIGS